jgi:hypothetical protein
MRRLQRCACSLTSRAAHSIDCASAVIALARERRERGRASFRIRQSSLRAFICSMFASVQTQKLSAVDFDLGQVTVA